MVMYEMIISGYQETSMIQSDMTFLVIYSLQSGLTWSIFVQPMLWSIC